MPLNRRRPQDTLGQVPTTHVDGKSQTSPIPLWLRSVKPPVQRFIMNRNQVRVRVRVLVRLATRDCLVLPGSRLLEPGNNLLL